MTALEIKRLAILKWEWVVSNWDYSLDFQVNKRQLILSVPEIRDFSSNCSYCHCFFDDSNCSGCPLKEQACICCHEFCNWFRAAKLGVDGTPQARIMLEKIRRIK